MWDFQQFFKSSGIVFCNNVKAIFVDNYYNGKNVIFSSDVQDKINKI